MQSVAAAVPHTERFPRGLCGGRGLHQRPLPAWFCLRLIHFWVCSFNFYVLIVATEQIPRPWEEMKSLSHGDC